MAQSVQRRAYDQEIKGSTPGWTVIFRQVIHLCGSVIKQCNFLTGQKGGDALQVGKNRGRGPGSKIMAAYRNVRNANTKHFCCFAWLNHLYCANGC